MKERIVLLSVLVLMACAPGRSPEQSNTQVVHTADLGIEPVALRLTAKGTMLDLRYRVTDPQRAVKLLDRSKSVYLLHEASGKVFPVPVMAKLGPIRQITQQPKEGKIYFVLFSNTGRLIHAGDLATLVLGDLRLQHLLVE